MRWLIALILIVLLVLYVMEDPEPVPVEESFIKEPVKALRSAEGVEEDYLEATRRRQEEMEKALEEQSGGG